jgi:hypothetical protein
MRATLSPLSRIWPEDVNVSSLNVARAINVQQTKTPSRLFRVGLCGLLDLDGVVDDQVHEFVKALERRTVCQY